MRDKGKDTQPESQAWHGVAWRGMARQTSGKYQHQTGVRQSRHDKQ